MDLPFVLLSGAAAHSAVGSAAENITLKLLYQLVVIFCVTRVVVWVSRKYLGQTDVAGEILAGLTLGPSLLGGFAPDLMNALFVTSTSTIFVGVAQVGLILLMFQIGLEFQFGAALSRDGNRVFAISAASIIVPAALGYVTAPYFYAQMPEPRPLALGFQLFFAIAMAVTAIPILGRIFMELSLSHTRTAALTIASAAIGDVLLWIMLGAVGALVSSSFDAGEVGLRALGVAIYVGFVLLVVRRVLKPWIERALARDGHLSSSTIGVLLIALLMSATVTSLLGVFAIIGGFILGVSLHDNRKFVQEWDHRVSALVKVFFLPIFFAYTGLRTDIGSLAGSDGVIQLLLVLAIAFGSKFGATFAVAKLMGEPMRSALAIGVSMNTRALMELIVLNVGYDLGVLPRQMFTMLVIMAIVSTFMATPLIRVIMASERRIRPPARSATQGDGSPAAVERSADPVT